MVLVRGVRNDERKKCKGWAQWKKTTFRTHTPPPAVKALLRGGAKGE